MVTAALSGPREGPFAATSTRGRSGGPSVICTPCFCLSCSTNELSWSRLFCCFMYWASLSWTCSYDCPPTSPLCCSYSCLSSSSDAEGSDCVKSVWYHWSRVLPLLFASFSRSRLVTI